MRTVPSRTLSRRISTLDKKIVENLTHLRVSTAAYISHPQFSLQMFSETCKKLTCLVVGDENNIYSDDYVTFDSLLFNNNPHLTVIEIYVDNNINELLSVIVEHCPNVERLICHHNNATTTSTTSLAPFTMVADRLSKLTSFVVGRHCSHIIRYDSDNQFIKFTNNEDLTVSDLLEFLESHGGRQITNITFHNCTLSNNEILSVANNHAQHINKVVMNSRWTVTGMRNLIHNNTHLASLDVGMYHTSTTFKQEHAEALCVPNNIQHLVIRSNKFLVESVLSVLTANTQLQIFEIQSNGIHNNATFIATVQSYITHHQLNFVMESADDKLTLTNNHGSQWK